MWTKIRAWRKALVDLKFHPYKSLTKEADKTAVLNSSVLGFDKHSPLLDVKISLNQLNFYRESESAMSLPFIRCYLVMKEYYLLLTVHLLVTLSLAHFILEIAHSNHSLVNQKGNKHNTGHVLNISNDIWPQVRLSGRKLNLLHFGVGVCMFMILLFGFLP